MAGTTVLVVDDDAEVRTLLRRCLEGDGYAVREGRSQEDVLRAIRGGGIGLITLDLGLGGESGIEIARAVRKNSQVPIIMVTGRGDVIDRVVGLEVGADDYIAKPFHVREVLARVRSVLRRTEAGARVEPQPSAAAGTVLPADEVLGFAGFMARPATMELRDPGGSPVELTSGDFRLLQVFLDHPGGCFRASRSWIC